MADAVAAPSIMCLAASGAMSWDGGGGGASQHFIRTLQTIILVGMPPFRGCN